MLAIVIITIVLLSVTAPRNVYFKSIFFLGNCQVQEEHSESDQLEHRGRGQRQGSPFRRREKVFLHLQSGKVFKKINQPIFFALFQRTFVSSF